MLDTDLLRLVTAGSVDDGKSTLIGRLLYDTKQLLVDQLEHIEDASRRRGHDYVDLALVMDGLRAEREQGITIDVAYRGFVTPRRRFQLADAPGPRPVHAQHGHGRLDRRPGGDPRRRAQGRRRADPPPLPTCSRCSSSRTSCSRSTRWISSTSRRSGSTTSPRDLAELAARLEHARRARDPDLGAEGRQRRRPVGGARLVRRARRCSSISSRSRSAATCRSCRAASRCSG